MRRNQKIALFFVSSVITTGAGLLISWAFAGPQLTPPSHPAELPPPRDEVLEKVEQLLAFEAKNPEQFWYNRGFDGETLGIAPAPTDIWFALGSSEKAAGLPRRDVRSKPPSNQDWAKAGVTRLVVAQPPRPIV